MRKVFFVGLFLMILIGRIPLAMAHFGMIIPSDEMVMQQDNRTIQLTLSFSHPFELVGMELAKPAVFKVVTNNKTTDLRDQLQKVSVMGQTAWQSDYKVTRPGSHLFYMEPEPYWEPAEDSFIVHHTKTVVAVFGDSEGWDRELGLKTEIVPLSKPFGLYAGNVFQGIVKVNQKPVPYTEVEVEFYNEKGQFKAPTEQMITQTIKADANGLFTYAVPQAGWWGFAALTDADFTISHEGVEKTVEIGAVIWVNFHEMD